MSEFTVGLDWGAREHSVCVVDASGRVRARWRVPRDREGLERLLRDLRRLADPSEFPIAIERPSGLLVDTLMDAGHLHRFADCDHLASEAGVAPVTRASGKSHHVSSRFACNRRLKNAITTWANNSRHADPRAPCIYDRARATPGG